MRLPDADKATCARVGDWLAGLATDEQLDFDVREMALSPFGDDRRVARSKPTPASGSHPWEVRGASRSLRHGAQSECAAAAWKGVLDLTISCATSLPDVVPARSISVRRQ